MSILLFKPHRKMTDEELICGGKQCGYMALHNRLQSLQEHLPAQ